MSTFNKCDCSWCTRNRYKLLSYLRCTTEGCGNQDYFPRITRIDISSTKKEHVCGFICYKCSLVQSENKTQVDKTSSFQLEFMMCQCHTCKTYKNIQECVGYCNICEQFRRLHRLKRVDKLFDKTISRCGFQCAACSYFHIEIESVSPKHNTYFLEIIDQL